MYDRPLRCLYRDGRRQGHQVLYNARRTVQRKEITTIEGLAGEDGKLHPVQQAFWDESGFQCAYCSPGMVLTTVELLELNPKPTDAEIRLALSGNLCRCTGYQSIVRAVRASAGMQTKESEV